MAADVDHRPDVPERDPAVGGDAVAVDLRDVTQVAPVTAETHPRSARQSAAPRPARQLPYTRDDGEHPSGVQARAEWRAPRRPRLASGQRTLEQLHLEVDRVLLRGVGDLVEERLKHERVRVVARRTQRTDGYVEWNA